MDLVKFKIIVFLSYANIWQFRIKIVSQDFVLFIWLTLKYPPKTHSPAIIMQLIKLFPKSTAEI